jgi:hypothetical protein
MNGYFANIEQETLNNMQDQRQTQPLVQKSGSVAIVLAVLIFATLLFAGAFFIPWSKIKWGQIQFTQPETITVSGYAETQQKTQIARFSAGVSSTSDNKDDAISFVNQKVEGIISAVKGFGIESADIKTQNINVYQQEETYWEEGRQKSRPGQWRVSNNIEITLRNVDKASELTSLLTSTGATQVYGPSFSLDDTSQAQTSLLKDAIEDAKVKAAVMAEASGKKLGGIINLVESSSSPVGIYPMMEKGGGGAAVEPGTSSVSKSVTVTFKLE